MYNLQECPDTKCFTINENAWDGMSCDSAGGHWNPTAEAHGVMNSYPSHAGDLLPFIVSSSGPISYYSASADKPTLYGTDSIIGKSMTIHELPGDFYATSEEPNENNGNCGRPLACCNIRPYRVIKYTAHSRKLDDEIEEGVDVFTPEEFAQMFGED